MHNDIDNEKENSDLFDQKDINHGIRRIKNFPIDSDHDLLKRINSIKDLDEEEEKNIKEDIKEDIKKYIEEELANDEEKSLDDEPIEEKLSDNEEKTSNDEPIKEELSDDEEKISDDETDKNEPVEESKIFEETLSNIDNSNDEVKQDDAIENDENLSDLDVKPVKSKKSKKHFGIYLGWGPRLVIYSIIFVIFISLCIASFLRSFQYNEARVTAYNETSNLDYRVYLKPNEFYETDYLGKDMIYVASLIRNIDIDFAYRFQIDDIVDMDFTYDIIGKLSILDESGKSTFFEKEYTLLSDKQGRIENSNSFDINETVSIDYDYYNRLANNFRVEYGITTTSNLTVYLRINKNLTDNNGNSKINGSNDMSIVIPLTEKSININLNYNEINDSNYVAEEANFEFDNIINIVASIISFVITFIALTNVFKLISMLGVKKTNYDKFIKKILSTYDRLIVETTTMPDFNGKDIIKVSKFEELLDVRDNLKLPVMYYIIKKHEKCYFYIRQGKIVYLYTVKDIDLEKK